MISEELKWLIDFMVGDGHIAKYDYSYHCKLEHSTKQREYLEYKANILITHGFRGRFAEYKKVIWGKEHSSISFNMYVNDTIKIAYKWLVNKGRKTIDKRLLRVLDERSLAFWFMDDGGASKSCKSSSSPGNGFRYYYIYPEPKINQFNLYTYRFTDVETNLVQDWLLDRFGIHSRTSFSKRDGTHIVISTISDKQIFVDLLKPFIIPSMQYKIAGLLSYENTTPIDIRKVAKHGERPNEETPTEFSEDDAMAQGESSTPAKSS